VTLKVGAVRSITNLPVFVALTRGYFREEGVDLELEYFGSGVDILPQLGTSRVDIGEGSITPGFINAVARGLNIKAVADRASMGPGRDFAPLVVRRADLDNGAITSFSDLRGKRIAISNRWTGSHYKLVKLDERFGLREGDYSIETIGFADMPAALENGAVDAAVLIDPGAARAEQRGIVARLKDERHQPTVMVTLVAFSEEMLANKRDAGNRYMLAYLRGIRDLNEALAERGAKWEQLKAQVASEIPEFADPAIADLIAIAAVEPDGRVNARGYQELQDWYFDNGQIQRKIPVEEMIDNSFADWANSRLVQSR
jgi:NitT/TauT family transport system substrate-binding protein